jgi:hypothetical protein
MSNTSITVIYHAMSLAVLYKAIYCLLFFLVERYLGSYVYYSAIVLYMWIQTLQKEEPHLALNEIFLQKQGETTLSPTLDPVDFIYNLLMCVV